MAAQKWNETGRVWEEDHGLLDEEQVAKCERADIGETLRSPVPTRMITNGEYMPAPQTAKQKQVESRIAELAERASKKLGIRPAAIPGRLGRHGGGAVGNERGVWKLL